jgi:hypothetical protein
MLGGGGGGAFYSNMYTNAFIAFLGQKQKLTNEHTDSNRSCDITIEIYFQPQKTLHSCDIIN